MTSRLGPQAVVRSKFVNSHIPERAVRLRAGGGAHRGRSQRRARSAAPRPLRLLPRPSRSRCARRSSGCAAAQHGLAARHLSLRQSLRARADRRRMVDRARETAAHRAVDRGRADAGRRRAILRGRPRHPRLLHRRGRWRPALLAVPRGPVRGRGRAALVSARVLLMSGVVELPRRADARSRAARLCRAGLDLQFLVPARRLASGGAGAHRCGAQASRASASATATALPAWCAPMWRCATWNPQPEDFPLSGRHAALLCRRHARHRRLSHRPRGLWPALQAAEHRQSQERGREGRIRSSASAISRPALSDVKVVDLTRKISPRASSSS